jgi:hypothetical protein
MTTAVIIFRTEKPSDEVRSVRVVIADTPDLHLGDTFTLTTLSRFRPLKVAERHWEGTPKWLHITCFVEASTVANMIAELNAKQMNGFGDDYILPNQPWY